MTPDERNLIAGLFERLKSAEASAGPKDGEAASFIQQNVAAQPSAPYLLVQTVLVQEHALANAQTRIAALEQQLAAARPAQPSAGGSFLGGLADKLGPWGRRADQPAGPTAQPMPQPMPMPQQPMAPQPGYAAYASTAAMAPSAGGGFLRSALTTAAGVAGGALLFTGIENLLGHNAGAFGPGLGGGFGGSAWGGGGSQVNETVNNYYGNDPSQGAIPADDQQGSLPSDQDAAYQDAADYSDDTGDFGGGDSGGGDSGGGDLV